MNEKKFLPCFKGGGPEALGVGGITYELLRNKMNDKSNEHHPPYLPQAEFIPLFKKTCSERR
jgi:uncharacterized membrane protein YebE (DUF533 family)